MRHGKPYLEFAHGFGCDQSMWRFVLPLLSHQYTVLLYDLVGCGKSDLGAYDRDNIGHCPHMSTPAAVAGLIDEFVQELG